jgi:hypothetical protein
LKCRLLVNHLTGEHQAAYSANRVCGHIIKDLIYRCRTGNNMRKL